MVKPPPLWHLEISEMYLDGNFSAMGLLLKNLRLDFLNTAGPAVCSRDPQGFLAAHKNVFLVPPSIPKSLKLLRKFLTPISDSEVACPYAVKAT